MRVTPLVVGVGGEPMLVKLFTSGPLRVKDLSGPVSARGIVRAVLPIEEDGETRDLNPGKHRWPGQGSPCTFLARGVSASSHGCDRDRTPLTCADVSPGRTGAVRPPRSG